MENSEQVTISSNDNQSGLLKQPILKLILLMTLILISSGASFIVGRLTVASKINIDMTPPNTISSIPTVSSISPTNATKNQDNPTYYLGGHFSASASAFLETIYYRMQIPPTSSMSNISDPTQAATCETSGGKWDITREKDLPCTQFDCGINSEKIVMQRCDCTMKCNIDDFSYKPYEYPQLSTSKPIIDEKDKTNKYIIFDDSISACSYLASTNNSCKQCRHDSDCGNPQRNIGVYWYSGVVAPICDEGRCRYRKVVYSEI